MVALLTVALLEAALVALLAVALIGALLALLAAAHDSAVTLESLVI